MTTTTARGGSADTPLMRQYLETKEKYPDCLLFFRVGDFYELFFEDAVTVSRAVDIALTTRDKGKEDPVPMAGVPHHALRAYLGKLVERGFKVAICDQVEDPKLARGIVRREVTRVVTPGILVDEEQLEARAGCYLAAVVPAAGDAEWREVGFAYLDVSTGEFAACALDAGTGDAPLLDELARVAPRELLIPPGLSDQLRGLLGAGRALTETAAPQEGDNIDALVAEDRALLAESLAIADGELPLADAPHALRAAAACVRYAKKTQPAGALPLHRLAAYRPSEHLILDESTQQHLELFAPISAAGSKKATLLGVVDETRTAMGARLLRRFIAAPLTDVAKIRRRLDAVEWLVDHAALRATVRAALAEVYDLERLVGRATLGVATPRDLVALRRSLERLPEIARALATRGEDPTGLPLPADAPRAPRARMGPDLLAVPELLGPREDSDLCQGVAAQIAAAVVDEPPLQLTDGGVIRRGHSAELDELFDIAAGGKEKLLMIEARERERTGINSLKIRYNRVFGYYLEITKSNMPRVPADYVRKQTLATCERYTTPELTDYETKIVGADERRVALEIEIFAQLRKQVAAESDRLQKLAGEVARLDVLSTLAEVAHVSGWTRPEIDPGQRLDVADGRHPVVEKLAAAQTFVPNDTLLDPDDAQLLVITGPNMAGKSTVMRQVALIVILAQAGSYVPARRASIGIVDRVFTRVGASDNLARGESTFMVEMRETAHILSHATRRSLVLLDEIGRGTSTYDGVSIAWAVAEHLHDRIGAKTMFATHYHELVALARTRPRVRNQQVAVREWQDGIVFLHKLIEGGASRSYGIQVARLAGLPRAVVDRARSVLAALEAGEDVFGHGRPPGDTKQMDLFGAPPPPKRTTKSPPAPAAAPPTTDDAAVLAALRTLDPDDLTPRQAHTLLLGFCDRLRNKTQ